jgi:hypothetical protein
MDVSELSFEPARTPRNPDVPTSGPLLRRLAWRLLADHPRGADGFCVTCRPHQIYPCPARRLAIVGLRVAANGPRAAAWRVRTVVDLDGFSAGGIR